VLHITCWFLVFIAQNGMIGRIIASNDRHV